MKMSVSNSFNAPRIAQNLAFIIWGIRDNVSGDMSGPLSAVHLVASSSGGTRSGIQFYNRGCRGSSFIRNRPPPLGSLEGPGHRATVGPYGGGGIL